jgi:hypothetical protein
MVALGIRKHEAWRKTLKDYLSTMPGVGDRDRLGSWVGTTQQYLEMLACT